MKIDDKSHEPIDKPLNIDLEGENEDNNNYIFDKLESMKKEDVRITLKKYIESLKNKGDKAFQGLDIDDVINWIEEQKEPEDKGEISDGYHTFNELYYYRMLYNAAFFNMLPKEWVHKSLRHHTGEECFGGGWFIVIANLPTGQVSNHYETIYWGLFNIPEKDLADEWDSHTPMEAAKRIEAYIYETAVNEKISKGSDFTVSCDQSELTGGIGKGKWVVHIPTNETYYIEDLKENNVYVLEDLKRNKTEITIDETTLKNLKPWRIGSAKVGDILVFENGGIHPVIFMFNGFRYDTNDSSLHLNPSYYFISNDEEDIEFTFKYANLDINEDLFIDIHPANSEEYHKCFKCLSKLISVFAL